MKGQVSEKLALRHGAAIGSQQIMIRAVPQLLPRGLDASRLDFSPKEETDRTPIKKPLKALRWMASEWWDELCWGFAVMALWGLVRQRFILGLCRNRDPDDSGRAERRVLGVFAAVFILVLMRHALSLGYLSGRHMIPLVAISVPWAAAGTFVCLRGLGVKLPWSRNLAWGAGVVATSVVVGTLVVYQLRPSHPTRSGHWAAGQWLAEHAQPSDVVLDTRGWARFISGTPGYDYWHVRQALTDSHLSYVVVGHEELAAGSSRAQDPQCSAGLRGDAGRRLSRVCEQARRGCEDLPVPPARLVGGTRPMRYGSLWQRLVRGVRWSWVDPRYQAMLPPNLDATVMAIDSRDRLHAKQGRSTARVVFHPAADKPERSVAVYLKRHYRLPWLSGIAALFDPAGRHSPGAAEWAHLERARALGVPVPDVVATGERIGPWAFLQSYLMVAELTGVPGAERGPARTGPGA